MAATRILFVVSEHEAGITPERRARYDAIQERLGSLTSAAVDSAPYWALDSPAADALVLSGSADPWAMHDPDALERFSEVIRAYPGPVLGICAGMQMLVRARGGSIRPAATPTRGFAAVDVADDTDLLAGAEPTFEVFKSHEDEVGTLPEAFRILATSRTCAIEAIAAVDRPWWGTQFHPEAWDAEHPAGRALVEQFLRLALNGRSASR